MTPPDPRYAHWQQQPGDDLDYVPERDLPGLHEVRLEPEPDVAEQMCRTMEPPLLAALMTRLLNGTISCEAFYNNFHNGEVTRLLESAEDDACLEP